MAEAARLAGVSRQRLHQHCKGDKRLCEPVLLTAEEAKETKATNVRGNQLSCADGTPMTRHNIPAARQRYLAKFWKRKQDAPPLHAINNDIAPVHLWCGVTAMRAVTGEPASVVTAAFHKR